SLSFIVLGLSQSFCVRVFFFFSCYAYPRYPHSFPTRRSSDLAGADCQIGQVDSSYVPPITGQTAPTAVPTSAALAAPYNNANGFATLPQPADYTLVNLGATPTFALFGVNANEQLVQLDILQRVTLETPAPIGENVVNLQVLYGIDDGSSGGVANDNVVDSWVAPTGAWSFASLQADGEDALAIKALRLAIVVRS